MKKTKKLLGVVLAVLMIMSVFSVNSFAIDFFKTPEIESVTFTDSNPVSKKELKTYFDEIQSYIDEMSEILGEDFDFGPMTFSLATSNIEYEMDVKFTDGTVTSISNDDFYVAYGDDETPVAMIDAYITYEEYLDVVNGKKSEIQINISATSIYLTGKDKTFTATKKAVSKFVESFEIVSGVPSEIYEFADYYNLSDAVLKVKYKGKDAKTFKIKLSFDETGAPVYTIDGKRAYVYSYDNALYIDFLDAEIEKKVKYKAEPFKKIEITECAFDEETLSVKSLTYKVTFTNGTTKSYNYTAPEATGDQEIFTFGNIGRLKGFYVSMSYTMFEIDDEAMTIDLEKIKVNVSVGYDKVISDEYELANPYAEELAPYADIINFIYKAIAKISDFIYNLSNIFYF